MKRQTPLRAKHLPFDEPDPEPPDELLQEILELWPGLLPRYRDSLLRVARAYYKQSQPDNEDVD